MNILFMRIGRDFNTKIHFHSFCQRVGIILCELQSLSDVCLFFSIVENRYVHVMVLKALKNMTWLHQIIHRLCCEKFIVGSIFSLSNYTLKKEEKHMVGVKREGSQASVGAHPPTYEARGCIIKLSSLEVSICGAVGQNRMGNNANFRR